LFVIIKTEQEQTLITQVTLKSPLSYAEPSPESFQ